MSDNGPQLVSEDLDLFSRNNGVRHVLSAPSNGAAERTVLILKSAHDCQAERTGSPR